MSYQDFAYWLQGFVEISKKDQPTKEEWKIIKEHLEAVFNRSAARCGCAGGGQFAYGQVQAVPANGWTIGSGTTGTILCDTNGSCTATSGTTALNNQAASNRP